jgi:hypothetical protein
VHELKQKGVALKATEQPIDTSMAAGKAFFDILGVFAEFKTNLRRERQAEGIKQVKKAGVYHVGKCRIDREAVLRLSADGHGLAAIAQLGVSSIAFLHSQDPDLIPVRTASSRASTLVPSGNKENNTFRRLHHRRRASAFCKRK